MLDSIAIAETGIQGQQKVIDHVSHNLANLNTPAFKRHTVEFITLINLQQPESHGLGIQSESTISLKEGPLKQTGNIFDLAIRGEGYFEIETEQGDIMFSRLGQFTVDENGFLRTLDGHYLSGNTRIPAEADQILIDETGKVLARYPGSNATREVGQISLVKFASAENLELKSGGYFSETQASGPAQIDESSSLFQGYVEASNVDLVAEMGDMMLAQHAYQMNSKMLQVSDEILGIINNLKR